MTTAGQANEQEVRELAEYLLTSDWLARVRREAKAEAWDEAVLSCGPFARITDNPYRREAGDPS